MPNSKRIAGLVGPTLVAMLVSEFPLVIPRPTLTFPLSAEGGGVGAGAAGVWARATTGHANDNRPIAAMALTRLRIPDSSSRDCARR